MIAWVRQKQYLEARVRELEAERDRLREALEWIVRFAEKDVKDGPLVGRHTGFVHIVRRAQAALGPQEPS